MIPIAIAIGIIEDKIANDLTGSKTTKEHLEDIKHKLKDYKTKPKAVNIVFNNGKTTETKADQVQTTNGFVKIIHDGLTEYINAKEIKSIKVTDDE